MLTDGMFVSAMERPAGTRRAYAGCRITGVAQVPGHEITITRRLPASRVITRPGPTAAAEVAEVAPVTRQLR